MRVLFYWILLVFISISHASPPRVNVALRTSWPAPPLLLELLETAALEDESTFFPLIHYFSDPLNAVEGTSRDIYDSAVNVIKPYLDKTNAYTSFVANMALHAASPKLEAYFQFYESQNYSEPSHEYSNCTSWVYWYGERVCDGQTLQGYIFGKATSSAGYQRPRVLAFDHILPSHSSVLNPPPRTAILYASLKSANFRELHSVLYQAAQGDNPKVEYIFRHVTPIPLERDKMIRTPLGGYGVFLDLKKTDYLALDDRNPVVRRKDRLEKDMSEEDGAKSRDEILDLLLRLEHTLPTDAISNATSNVTISKEQISNLGLQATQLIQATPDHLKLSTLQLLSQNFPKYSRHLSSLNIDSALLEETAMNSMHFPAGTNGAWLNGLPVQTSDMNIYGLIKLMRKERRIVNSLTTSALGLSRFNAISLLTNSSHTEKVGQFDLDGLFDASDRPEGSDVIVWWNNFEKDRRYARWNPSLYAMMRPQYPGQFHHIKLNILNVVLVVDLSQVSTLNLIANTISNIINRGFPFRFGIVPMIETADGEKMARLFYHMIETVGRGKTMRFLKGVTQVHIDQMVKEPRQIIDWTLVLSELSKLASEEITTETGSEKDSKLLDLHKILDDSTENPSRRDLGPVRLYSKRLETIRATSEHGHAFVNGRHFVLDDNFLQNMQMEVSAQMQHIQEMLYRGLLSDDDSSRISTYFYDLPTTNSRRNQFIYPTTTNRLMVIPLPELFPAVDNALADSNFLYPAHSDEVQTPLTVHLIADLDTSEAQQMIRSLLLSMRSDSAMRLSFVHNPSKPFSGMINLAHEMSSRIAQLQTGRHLSVLTPRGLAQTLQFEDEFDDSYARESGKQRDLNDLGVLEAETYANFVHQGLFVARRAAIAEGAMALLVNGRVIGPLKARSLTPEDLEVLMTYEFENRARPIIDILNARGVMDTRSSRFTRANLVALASSIVAASTLPDPSEAGLRDVAIQHRRKSYVKLQQNSLTSHHGDEMTATFHFGFVLDPLSDDASRWTSLIQWLAELPDTYVQLHLNPGRPEEMPLKRFYRYNIQHSLSFDTNGSEIQAQGEFEKLPLEPIYTLGMDVPQAWLVRPRQAKYDLDNIQLNALSREDEHSGLKAVFDLDFLVVEGHARETKSNAPPRGLQLQLTDWNSTSVDDTQVVASLGYLQFKAKPGVYKLEIREGRGSEIYTMESVGNEGWDSPIVAESGTEITLGSFDGITIFPRLVRNPDMEDADVLEHTDHLESKPAQTIFETLVSRVSSLLGPQDVKSTEIMTAGSPQADINIFTVASGLLYERFASIMILSVLKNTNSTVKFWFIENFLSPSFLEFIPHFARHYNFQYELVTYKWPSWLRAQKEKQRVLFVDADQIVRADLQELVDLDLQGAPYGYTPMGEDNYDMEGFRFWKTGYWKEFLRGMPYHISALYVIDLVRFREIAAGDILRQHYHQLSADPNSLANLDQDLPNNLQREIPIFSLHEDWLWCETWCSKDRLDRAKTIDLCQNPLTKEPKLSRARQIPEWEEYDNTVSAFARGLVEQGRIGAAAAVDTNVLAGNIVTNDAVQVETEVPSDGSVIRDEL